MNWKLLVLLVSVPVTAAGNLIAGRYALDSFSPVEANAMRYLLALVVLLPLLGRWPRPERRDVPWLIGTGLVGICIYNILFFRSLELIPASEAGLIEMIIPAASLALAWLVLRERIAARQVVGIAAGWVGMLWLMRILPTDAASEKSSDDWRGEILMVVAVLLFAVYAIISKFAMRRLPPPAVATWSCLIGTVPLVLLAAPGLIGSPETFTEASAASWLGVAYGGVIGFVYNIIAWYYCFRQVGVAKTNVFLYLVPVFGAMLAVPIFDESLSGWQIFGSAVTLVGVVLATWERSPRGAADGEPAAPPEAVASGAAPAGPMPDGAMRDGPLSGGREPER
ncbi:DMT family transporter [Actinomadura sp. 3N508]|uniref:DMT family transporter n=1 Tax=Actinomadura sp. 3N508 TaxID=3375153 RepID=UPI00379740B8